MTFQKLSDRVGHVQHWETSFHERECPECCLVDCLVAESVALGLVSLNLALPTKFTANDRVLIAICDCLESRCDYPPVPGGPPVPVRCGAAPCLAMGLGHRPPPFP